MDENNAQGAPAPQKSGNQVWFVVIAVIAALGVYYAIRSGNSVNNNQSSTAEKQEMTASEMEKMDNKDSKTQEASKDKMENSMEANGTGSGGMENKETAGGEQPQAGTVREFAVTGSNFKYDVTEIKVKKGEKVKIKFINAEGFHDWVLDEFNAKTKQFKAPGEEIIEFVADKAGSFEFYCSVGTHRAMGMVGKFIVE